MIIGWKEWVSLPEWGIHHLSAKSDTGASGSAIDVARVRELGEGRVRFDVILDRGERTRTQTVEADILGRVKIRSSNGARAERFRVRTTVRIGGIEKKADFTLVCRRRMIHRVLLGRTFLDRDFLVDSHAKYLLSPHASRSGKTAHRSTIHETTKP